jgi:predicted DNA-binding antitoxin AbrB/MazE fold protein
MTETIEAIFDGMVFRPLEPVDLPPNTRVTMTFSETRLDFEDMTAFLGAADESFFRPLREDGKNPDEMGDLEKYIYENYVYSDFNNPEK